MKNYNLTELEQLFVKQMVQFLIKKECYNQARYWCRRIGHPNGTIYYNMGFEPDMTCKDCGEDLG